MAVCTTRRCDRPTQAVICPACEHTLAADLQDIGGLRPDPHGRHLPSLVAELGATRTGHTTTNPTGISTIGHTTDRPLPYNDRAAAAAQHLATTVATWATEIARTAGHTLDSHHTAPAARFLLRYPHTIRTHPAAGQLADAISAATQRARRVIDRPTDRIYLGGCVTPGCADGDVYAPLGAQHGRCRACGARYDVTTRRAWLLAEVADWSVTRDEITALGGKLYPGVKGGTVRSWISRGRLVPSGWGDDGAPRYRIGDVADLATNAAAQPRHAGGQAA